MNDGRLSVVRVKEETSSLGGSGSGDGVREGWRFSGEGEGVGEAVGSSGVGTGEAEGAEARYGEFLMRRTRDHNRNNKVSIIRSGLYGASMTVESCEW